MAFYIGEMKKVRNSFFEAYKDGDYKKAGMWRRRWPSAVHSVKLNIT